MAPVVQFENVSKRYRGGGPRYGSIRHDLSTGFQRIRHLLVGTIAKQEGKLALNDVSFEIQQGQSFALIGPNGAGKTTALKLISRISYPTAGRILVRGRVGALIEVGSGVHPELTARENIWLYGQILGMSKVDIRRRFDEIVEFAELAQNLDTPVKMYSSGMQLRLGFAIAAHLDPDIFVVDEALAVGDAAFQARCVERMTKLVAEGRSLLFVSHNLSVVEAVCQRGVFMLDGKVEAEGLARDVLRSYIGWVDEGQRQSKALSKELVGHGLTVERTTVHAADGIERRVFEFGESIEIRLHVFAHEYIPSAWFSVGISDGRPGALVLCTMLERGTGIDLAPGRHTVSCCLTSVPLTARTYEIWVSVRERSAAADLIERTRVGTFRIQPSSAAEGPSSVTAPWMYAPVRVAHDWRVD